MATIARFIAYVTCKVKRNIYIGFASTAFSVTTRGKVDDVDNGSMKTYHLSPFHRQLGVDVAPPPRPPVAHKSADLAARNGS